MIEEGSSRDKPIPEFEADGEAVPILATSDTEDVRNPFIILDGDHSAVVNVVCSPLCIPVVLKKQYYILQCVLIPCCDSSLSAYHKCIDRFIGANFKPGRWIDGDCHQFDPVAGPNKTCAERTQEASLSFSAPSNQRRVARYEANCKRKRHSGSDKEPTAKSKEPDAKAKTTALQKANDKQKRDGSIGESTATAKAHDAKDDTTAQRLIQQLVAGIQQAMNEDLNPAAQKMSDDNLAQYRQRVADDEGELEGILWKRATDVEIRGRESAWMDKLMFSACRCYRRVKQMNILGNQDPTVEAQQKRWEVGGQVLNEIVNGLYTFRKELALVVYRAARRKSLLFFACTNVSAERRAGIVKAVVEGLRFTPIAAALNSCVMLPPAYLNYIWGLEYSEVCTSLKLGNLADLKFTESELAGCAWEMPLSFLIRERNNPGSFRIIEKNGVRLLTDTVVNPIVAGGQVLSANERGQAAFSSPIPAPVHPVEATPTTLFKPVNKRQRTEQYTAGEVCRSNSGGVAEASPPHVHLTTNARERGDVRSIDRAGNGEQHHHSLQLLGFDHAGSVRPGLSPYNSIAVPLDSEPGEWNGEADPRCHGQESAAFMSDAQGPKTPHVEAAAENASPWVTHRDGLRRSSPSNIGANSPPATESASRGWEESRTSDGVLAAREASSLSLLADAAGLEHEGRRSAEAAPTLGPTEQILPHNIPPVPVDFDSAAGDDQAGPLCHGQEAAATRKSSAGPPGDAGVPGVSPVGKETEGASPRAADGVEFADVQSGQVDLNLDLHGNPINFNPGDFHIDLDSHGDPMNCNPGDFHIDLDSHGDPMNFNPEGFHIDLDSHGDPMNFNPEGFHIDLDSHGDPMNFNPEGFHIDLDSHGDPMNFNPEGFHIDLDSHGDPMNPNPGDFHLDLNSFS